MFFDTLYIHKKEGEKKIEIELLGVEIPQQAKEQIPEVKAVKYEPVGRLTFVDIFRADLHDFIFKEDELGRYRERIIKNIETYGVKNWFEKMGYPTADDSIWINRNTKDRTTLGNEVNKYGNLSFSAFKGLESQGYYLWENWLPEKLWNDKAESELMSEYKVGTKEHHDRLLLEEKNRKKYAKKIKDKPLENPIIEVTDKLITIKVKYGLDYNDKRDFFITDNRSEVGIESYMGGCGSSAFGSKIGQAEKTLDEKEKEALEWVIKGILEDGVKRENISIIKEEMNAEDIKKHNAWKEERRKTDLKYAEKEIEEYSKKLKNALKIKFGFEVTLKVEKK